MTEVQWFIGIRRRIFNDNRITCHLFSSKHFIFMILVKERQPVIIRYNKVKESFYHVILRHHLACCDNLFTKLISYDFWRFLSHFHERENDHCQIAFKLRACLLKINLLYRRLLSVKLYKSIYKLLSQYFF